MWFATAFNPAWTSLNSSANINHQPNDGFEVPSMVMRTAAAPKDDGSSLQILGAAQDENSPSKYHIFLYFAEIELLRNQSRIFDIYLNGNLWVDAFSPRYLETDNIFTEEPLSFERYNITISEAAESTLPPILNAIEIYEVKQSGMETDGGDVDAIMEVKASYQVKKNWMGDPCVPTNFTWHGLNCSSSGSEPPRIISLNLAHSGLTGEIAAALGNLESLRNLDLSGNNLSGPVPDALGELPYLEFLNLSSNQLTGSIPRSLQERSKNGSLKLSIENNPDLCYASDSCERHRKISVPIIIVLSAVPVVLLVVAISAWMIRRKQQELATVSTGKPERELCSSGLVKDNNGPFQLESQQFIYKDLVRITKNFERAIGKGGFGTVYYGELGDGTQVAVKLRSQSSMQGTKEFLAEAQLLTRVHHRNLVSLVGYCKDENSLALVYEYMAQGSLQEHLAGKTSKPGALHWIERLRIALEAAQGLEYLHKGCRPPIIHRDVKTTNILLSHGREAKIADFGLSKVFQSDTLTHVSTAIVGTPGYVDPEYYYTYQLNEKSDVFSFGVVLLELITGQAALPKIPDRGHIIQWVRPWLARGDIGNVVDKRMEGQYDTNSVWKAAEIAMQCTLPTAIQRPTMSDVVMQLKDCLSLELACERTEILCMDGLNISYGDSAEGDAEVMKATLGPSAR
ncbi:senescence-induced receptor-like serine/threonine-protein kinase isoform X2 [Phoenix dactylifera]|nr:senescence-induced receptor-like serine/threonine-protein kinase isoform X2 [Phoenix dactylifera]